jgi:hypothetical protein
LILVVWFVRNGVGSQSEVEGIDKDLYQIQIMLDEACSSMIYRNNYNPLTESGALTIADDVCMRSSLDNQSGITRCIRPLCAADRNSIDLSKVTELVISKSSTVVIDGR